VEKASSRINRVGFHLPKNSLECVTLP
jgi:hypothetical protein